MKPENIKLAYSILDSFKESSLYDDYKGEDGFTDEQYQNMLDELTIMLVLQQQ
jgi:hypothetical protein